MANTTSTLIELQFNFVFSLDKIMFFFSIQFSPLYVDFIILLGLVGFHQNTHAWIRIVIEKRDTYKTCQYKINTFWT